VRIARELVAESAIVALAGGAAGVVLARAGLPVLIAVLPKDTPRVGEIAVDSVVMGAVLAVATIVGLLFGLAPAAAAARLQTAPLLRAGASSESRQTKRARALLVSGEIALALVLAVGAGLMLQSLWRMQHVNPGFAADRVLTLHLQPTDIGFRRSRTTFEYYELVLDRLRAIPGVTSAGAIQHLPFSGYSWTAALDIQGIDIPPGTSRPTAGLRIATPEYFKAIGQPLVFGRDFAPQDAERKDAVVVNQFLAKKYFGSAGAALGRRLRTRGGGTESPWMTVIGVVGDIRHDALTAEPAPEIYVSISPNSINAMMLAIRAKEEPLALVPAVREAIWSVDRNVPISDIQTMTAKVGTSLARPRLLMLLLTGFAALGLVLSVVGVYGVVAYSVTQRRREIGIMLALGAERARVICAVLRQGLLYALGGLATGVPVAIVSSRLMRGVVYGITPTDPLTYAAIAATIVGIVVGASVMPAYRASRVDPLTALRSE
jgi:predicted permease